MTILANVEWLPWVNLVVTAFLTIAVAYLGAKNHQIDSLKTGLEQATGKLIEQRFREIQGRCQDRCDSYTSVSKKSEELMLAMASLSERIKTIDGRLEKGDKDFDKLGDRGADLDRRLIVATNDVKDFVRDNYATKKELERVEERVDQVLKAV